MSLAQISSLIAGRHSGADVRFASVSTDTRTLQAGELYVALVGEHFDANVFVDKAFKKGACGAIVSATLSVEKPLVQVEDTTIALGQIARLNRLRSKARFIAITGSQGKTTVKEMCAVIMAASREVLVTRANFNNHIGVPLTLLALDASHECAVLELGASGLGEIAYTAAMLMPDIALLTNAAATHIEGFGDLSGVVRTKGEIIDALGADGVAILNADDPHFLTWKARAGKRKTLSFGLEKEADYRASQLQLEADGSSKFTMHTPQGEVQISLRLVGKHNVLNALAAAAACQEAGASLQDIAQGLEKARAVAGRLSVLSGLSGSILIDDSYNASPASFRAAIDVLAAQQGHRILIVGDMGELGERSAQEHARIGEYARARGIDELWSTGAQSVLASEAFGSAAQHFEQQVDLIEKAKDELHQGVVALVKGSRSAAMDRVVKQLKLGVSS